MFTSLEESKSKYSFEFTCPYTPNFVLLYTSPITSLSDILPSILPGLCFSPFFMFAILVVTNSPNSISTIFPVSISCIPCPNETIEFVCLS